MSKLNAVLLIDDDNVNNHLNKKLISELNLADEVFVETNGALALKFLEAHKNNCPSLIFLDINMPAVDGFQFLDAFQKMDMPNKENIVIVVLTTSTNKWDIDKIKYYGNYEYLNKPLKEEKLLEIINKYF